MQGVRVFSNSDVKEVEKEINAWLANMKGVADILCRTQSSSAWNNLHCLTIVIWYKMID